MTTAQIGRLAALGILQPRDFLGYGTPAQLALAIGVEPEVAAAIRRWVRDTATVQIKVSDFIVGS